MLLKFYLTDHTRATNQPQWKDSNQSLQQHSQSSTELLNEPGEKAAIKSKKARWTVNGMVSLQFPHFFKKERYKKKIISLQIRCSFHMFCVIYINGKWYFVGKDSLAHSLVLSKFCLAHISTTIPQECAECSGWWDDIAQQHVWSLTVVPTSFIWRGNIKETSAFFTWKTYKGIYCHSVNEMLQCSDEQVLNL